MYFLIGNPSKSGLRDLIQIYPRPDGRRKSRYMQSRKLSSGQAAYYWSPPTWAREQGYPLPGQALGPDFIKALIRADLLNDFLDDWRQAKKKKEIQGPF